MHSWTHWLRPRNSPPPPSRIWALEQRETSTKPQDKPPAITICKLFVSFRVIFKHPDPRTHLNLDQIRIRNTESSVLPTSQILCSFPWVSPAVRSPVAGYIHKVETAPGKNSHGTWMQCCADPKYFMRTKARCGVILTVLWIGMFVPDPTTATKEAGGKISCPIFLGSLKFYKIVINFIFWTGKENNLSQFTKNYCTF